jgi:hypothetical protein
MLAPRTMPPYSPQVFKEHTKSVNSMDFTVDGMMSCSIVSPFAFREIPHFCFR